MKTFILVCLSVIGTITANVLDKYKDVNIDEMMAQCRLTTAYGECILGRGKCTKEALDFKEAMEQLTKNQCSDCTEDQQKGLLKVVAIMKKTQPTLFEEIIAFFKPSEENYNKYKPQVDSYPVDESKFQNCEK